jgi:hypothetical protein
VIKTGGLMEIRVYNQEDVFAAHAYFLRNFRDELFRKCVNWKFPVHSFLSELDSLVSFYLNNLRQIQTDTYAEKGKILNTQLIIPLSNFFKFIDQDFDTKYFKNRMVELETEKPIEKRKIPHAHPQLSIRVVNSAGLPVPMTEIKIAPKKVGCVVSGPFFIPTNFLETNSHGFAEINLPIGYYTIMLTKKHGKTKTVNLYRNVRVELKVFTFFEWLKHLIEFKKEERKALVAIAGRYKTQKL